MSEQSTTATRRARGWTAGAVMVTVALVAGACGGDDTDTDAAATTTAADGAADPTTTIESTTVPATPPPDDDEDADTESDGDDPAPARDDVTEDELPDLPDLALVARGAGILDVTSEYDDTTWSAINLLDGSPDVGWSSDGRNDSIVIGVAHTPIDAIALDTRRAQEGEYPGISATRVLIESHIEPGAFPNGGWETVGTIEMSAASIGLLETPGLASPFLRFTVEDGGTEAYTEIMEIMVFGTLTERQVSFELVELFGALSPDPVGVEVLGETWAVRPSVDGFVLGCSASGAAFAFAPVEGGLSGVVRIDDTVRPAFASLLVDTFTIQVDPDGDTVRASGTVTPDGAADCELTDELVGELDGSAGSTSDGDDDVVEAETAPDSQREADPLIVVAAARDDADEVARQIADGADPDTARERDGWTALLFAAQDGYGEVVDVLVDAGASLDRGTDDGWTALMIASQNGHVDVVRTLLDAGARPEVGRSSNWTALHSAALRDHPDIVELLIAAGAPLEAAEDGFTPLALAAQEGADEVIGLLVDAGARVDGNPVDGPTPLYMATQNGWSTSVALLVDAGADLSDGGRNDPPIVTAGARDELAIAQQLVEAGADVDQARDDGFTALHWAAYNDNVEMVELLLELGADPAVVDDDGRTPLDVAVLRDSDAAAGALR